MSILYIDLLLHLNFLFMIIGWYINYIYILYVKKTLRKII